MNSYDSLRTRALRHFLATPLLLGLGLVTTNAFAAEGYYRYPALCQNTIVFAAEGDLFTVAKEGGTANRLTTHSGEESHPVFSPDCQQIAFTATYDGPSELYLMPATGGIPVRYTWENSPSIALGFTPEGELLYRSTQYSTLPGPKLVRVNPTTAANQLVPLEEAGDGAWADDGTLFFSRPGFHRNNTRRYQGGTARNIWSFDGAEEARNLTADFPGENHSPMALGSRVFYVNDRSGMMNLWSMTPTGEDLTQHTEHTAWDVKDPSVDAHPGSRASQPTIIYQLGADLWRLDVISGTNTRVPIEIRSDFEQLDETWEQEPMRYLTEMAIGPEGNRVALTSRGRVFVFPTGKSGRRVQLDRRPGVRYRDASFLDPDTVLLLSDESGEVEFETRPVTGVGNRQTLTRGGSTLRFWRSALA